MISVREAFSYETTAKVVIHLLLEGSWDDDNQWIKGGYGVGKPIRATMLPTGEKYSGTQGHVVKATNTGERYPATMKFRSTTEMPINAVIVYRGINYKITKRGDYQAGGYWSAVGQLIERLELT